MMYRGWCLASVRTLRGEVRRKSKPWAEALMNAGGNYNRPKVAKFLVGWVPTRTNGITIAGLSQRGTQWNCKGGEDASYPQLDEKTPWSFTTIWYWYKNKYVESMWEPQGDDETPHLLLFMPNFPTWICRRRQCLMGSLTGAVAS